MKRSVFVIALLLAAPLARADSSVDELARGWASCPFTLFLAQRRANRELELGLDGKIVLDGNAAPRVEYAVKLKRGRLRVRVFASGKSHVITGWHAPDANPDDKHALEIEGAGLAASIEVPDLAGPLAGIFKAAVEECLGAR